MAKLTEKEKAYQKEYHSRPENKARANAQARAKYEAGGREKKKEYSRRPEVKDRVRAWSKPYQRSRHLQKSYGITTEDFYILLASQGDVCACCGDDSWSTHGPCVDHDHETGEICGILCNNCNVAAGQLGDNPERAMMLMRYLMKTRSGSAA